MYDNHIGGSRFREIKSLIGSYINCDGEYHGLSIEEISDRAYQYYVEGELSSSQYDHVSGLIDDLM